MSSSLLLTNCSQLVTLRGPAPRRGQALANAGIIRNGAVLIENGKLAAVGPRAEIEALPEALAAEKLDAGGRLAPPRFVDSHPPLVVAASRTEKHEMPIAGAGYGENMREGGGDLFH